MAINDKDFYASHGISYDIEEMQIEYTKRVINQAKIEVLTELLPEIEKIEIDLPFGSEPVSKTAAFYEGVSASSRIIQEKINDLRGEK